MARELYLASNIQELNRLASLNHQLWNDKKIEFLISNAEKVFAKAKSLMGSQNEDQEKIYILLFRARDIWNILTMTKDFKKDEKYFKSMYLTKIMSCHTDLEAYSNKLRPRYIQRNLNNAEKTQFDITSSLKAKKRKGDEEKSISSKTNGVSHSIRNKQPNNEIKFTFKNVPQSSGPNEIDKFYGEEKFIECEVLKELIMINALNVLIIDIRQKSDFDRSKVTKARTINIPENNIIAGLSAMRLARCVTDEEEKSWWDRRAEYRQVVLLDWHSETKDIIPISPLSNLRTILLKWDPDTIYKSPPLILNGGFEKWLDMYPFLTTKPDIPRLPKPLESPFIHLSEQNIEYPFSELEDPKPKVDRTTKPDVLVISDKTEQGGKISEQTDTSNITSKAIEPLREEENTSNIAGDISSPDKEGAGTPSVRPVTPPRLIEQSYPTTPKHTNAKADQYADFSVDKIKSTPTLRAGGGLKRASSSPNIHKLVEDNSDNLFYTPVKNTPTFDRSTKPKTSYHFDDYIPRGGNMDTVYQHGKRAGGLTGLKNLGNLCYMNSIMQCISNTVELRLKLTHFNVKEVNTRRQIATELSTLLRVLWQGDTRVYSCRDLKSKVGCLRHSFSTLEQQDSHEFLTLLIDWLHEDLNQPSPAISLRGAEESTGEKAWGEFREKNNSIVVDLFYGQLKSTVKCSHCQKESVLFEPFSNLSIPLPANHDTLYEKDRRYSLHECLKLYLEGETISGWVCPSCKTPREATKKLDITRLPPMLIIHLKRFMSDMVGVGWIRKRMNMVDFPLSDLNMRPYTPPDSELRFHSYNLYAVSNHYGSMESGHYTAYCKNNVLNKWYKFDDSDVNEISPIDVRSAAAYILFFESSTLDRSRKID